MIFWGRGKIFVTQLSPRVSQAFPTRTNSPLYNMLLCFHTFIIQIADFHLILLMHWRQLKSGALSCWRVCVFVESCHIFYAKRPLPNQPSLPSFVFPPELLISLRCNTSNEHIWSRLKGLCYELRGYSVITNLALKIRSSVEKNLLNQACKYSVLVAFQLPLVPHLDWR